MLVDVNYALGMRITRGVSRKSKPEAMRAKRNVIGVGGGLEEASHSPI